MRTGFREFRYALRRLRSSPGFTIAATLTLAIAIGATTAVFSVVDGVLLKPLPYRDGDRVMMLFESTRGEPHFAVSPANYLDLRAQTHAFNTLAAASLVGEYLTMTGGQESQRLAGLPVTPNYFSVLGITPVLGRGLSQDSGGPAEIVLSHALWTEQFGGSSSVLGQKLTLNDRPYTIVGVMPAGLPDDGQVDVWTRLSFTAEDQTVRWRRYLFVWGRLKPDVTAAGAKQDLEAIAERLAQTYPQSNAGWSVRLMSPLTYWVGDVKPAFLMMLAAAACVLLIGAANLANLFLVRCLAREREVAVRTALGATRGRLVGELFVEAATLGLIASALGVGVAIAGVRGLRELAPAWLPRLSTVGVDVRVVSFCVLISVVTVLLFGMIPAWQVSRSQLADAIKQGGRGTGSAQHHRLQDSLVVLQVAIALVLLTGGGLLVQSFAQYIRLNPGFRPDGVLTAQITLPETRYPTVETQAAFIASAIEQLTAQPGVEAASASLVLPGEGAPSVSFVVLGDPVPDAAHKPGAGIVAVSPTYFRTMGIPLLRGRGLLGSDDSRAPKVAVIDELMAKRFFGGRDPIGQRLVMRNQKDTLEIVGVVAPVKQDGLTAEYAPEMYEALAQTNYGFATAIAIRTSGVPAAQTATLRRVIGGLDRTVPISQLRTLSQVVAQTVGTVRFSSFLASLFAVVALVLGAVGIYSVLAYVVSQRRREIAIRIALGAGQARVMGDVLWHALVLTSIGIALGSSSAWILPRVLARLFLGVNPHDPGIFIGAAATFAAVALVAAFVPAFRTTRISPVVALTSI